MSDRKIDNKGSAMVEAAIYFPIALIILFMIILLSAIQLGTFRMEVAAKEEDWILANWTENDIRYYARETSVPAAESDFGVRELPSAERVRNFFADTVESLSFPGERRVDNMKEAVQSVPSILKTLGFRDTVKILARKTSSYMVNHTRLCRVAEMYKNNNEIFNLLGYSFHSLVDRYPYSEE